ncbi:hypothetical protein F4780DRAFT_612127 [Xylariomycetidae sp. FL0641]|nr:hypothetical protein F4780DRAFT_612127 [Xylariomycetidae sp. FL0641]
MCCDVGRTRQAQLVTAIIRSKLPGRWWTGPSKRCVWSFGDASCPIDKIPCRDSARVRRPGPGWEGWPFSSPVLPSPYLNSSAIEPLTPLYLLFQPTGFAEIFCLQVSRTRGKRFLYNRDVRHETLDDSIRKIREERAVSHLTHVLALTRIAPENLALHPSSCALRWRWARGYASNLRFAARNIPRSKPREREARHEYELSRDPTLRNSDQGVLGLNTSHACT